MRGAGDDGGVEAEEESAERAYHGGLEQVRVKFHFVFVRRVRAFGRL